jgi:hypothetical protein
MIPTLSVNMADPVTAREKTPKKRTEIGAASPPHTPHQTAAQEIASDCKEPTSSASMADSNETQEKTPKERKGEDTRIASLTSDPTVTAGDDKKTVPSKVVEISSPSNIVAPKMPTPAEEFTAGVSEEVPLTSTPEPIPPPSTRSGIDSIPVAYKVDHRTPSSIEDPAVVKASPATEALEFLDPRADDIEEELTLTSTPEASLDSSDALISESSSALKDTRLDSPSDASLGRSSDLPSMSLPAASSLTLDVNPRLFGGFTTRHLPEPARISFGSTSQVGSGYSGGLFPTVPPKLPAKLLFSTPPFPLSPTSFTELAEKARAPTSKLGSGSSGGLLATSPSTPFATSFATLAKAAPASPPGVNTSRSGRGKETLKDLKAEFEYAKKEFEEAMAHAQKWYYNVMPREMTTAKPDAAIGHDKTNYPRHILSPKSRSGVRSTSVASKSALHHSPLPKPKATATEFSFRAAPLPDVKAVAIPSSFKFDHPEMQKPAKDVTLGNFGKGAFTSTATPAPAPRGQIYFSSLPQTSDFAFQSSSDSGPRRVPQASSTIWETASKSKIGELDSVSQESRKHLYVFPSSVRLRPPRSRASASSPVLKDASVVSPPPFTYVFGSADATPPTFTPALENTALSSVSPSTFIFGAPAPTTFALFGGTHSNPPFAPPPPSVFDALPAHILPDGLTFHFVDQSKPPRQTVKIRFRRSLETSVRQSVNFSFRRRRSIRISRF